MTFDLPAHQRQRIRELERKTRHLETVRQRLERLLAITLKAAAGQDCDPITLLAVLEQLDREAQQGATIDELVQVLRDTDPAKLVRTTAA